MTPRPDYFVGNHYLTCPACSRRFKYRANPHTRRVACPYSLCMRKFNVIITLTPVTTTLYPQPTSEEIEPPAEAIEDE